MYFDDFTKYIYSKGDANAVNIGWLDSTEKFHTGVVSDEFLQALMEYYKYPVFVCRGYHRCNLCSGNALVNSMPMIKYKGIKRQVGFYEIRVFGEGDVTYASPSMIFHYITCHEYLPPEEFVRAVLSFDKQTYEERFYKNPIYARDRFWLEQDRTLDKS